MAESSTTLMPPPGPKGSTPMVKLRSRGQNGELPARATNGSSPTRMPPSSAGPHCLPPTQAPGTSQLSLQSTRAESDLSLRQQSQSGPVSDLPPPVSSAAVATAMAGAPTVLAPPDITSSSKQFESGAVVAAALRQKISELTSLLSQREAELKKAQNDRSEMESRAEELEMLQASLAVEINVAKDQVQSKITSAVKVAEKDWLSKSIALEDAIQQKDRALNREIQRRTAEESERQRLEASNRALQSKLLDLQHSRSQPRKDAETRTPGISNTQSDPTSTGSLKSNADFSFDLEEYERQERKVLRASQAPVATASSTVEPAVPPGSVPFLAAADPVALAMATAKQVVERLLFDWLDPAGGIDPPPYQRLHKAGIATKALTDDSRLQRVRSAMAQFLFACNSSSFHSLASSLWDGSGFGVSITNVSRETQPAAGSPDAPGKGSMMRLSRKRRDLSASHAVTMSERHSVGGKRLEHVDEIERMCRHILITLLRREPLFVRPVFEGNEEFLSAPAENEPPVSTKSSLTLRQVPIQLSHFSSSGSLDRLGVKELPTELAEWARCADREARPVSESTASAWASVFTHALFSGCNELDLSLDRLDAALQDRSVASEESTVEVLDLCLDVCAFSLDIQQMLELWRLGLMHTRCDDASVLMASPECLPAAIRSLRRAVVLLERTAQWCASSLPTECTALLPSLAGRFLPLQHASRALSSLSGSVAFSLEYAIELASLLLSSSVRAWSLAHARNMDSVHPSGCPTARPPRLLAPSRCFPGAAAWPILAEVSDCFASFFDSVAHMSAPYPIARRLCGTALSCIQLLFQVFRTHPFDLACFFMMFGMASPEVSDGQFFDSPPPKSPRVSVEEASVAAPSWAGAAATEAQPRVAALMLRIAQACHAAVSILWSDARSPSPSFPLTGGEALHSLRVLTHRELVTSYWPTTFSPPSTTGDRWASVPPARIVREGCEFLTLLGLCIAPVKRPELSLFKQLNLPPPLAPHNTKKVVFESKPRSSKTGSELISEILHIAGSLASLVPGEEAIIGLGPLLPPRAWVYLGKQLSAPDPETRAIRDSYERSKGRGGGTATFSIASLAPPKLADRSDSDPPPQAVTFQPSDSSSAPSGEPPSGEIKSLTDALGKKGRAQAKPAKRQRSNSSTGSRSKRSKGS
jgi:hypothetical protein